MPSLLLKGKKMISTPEGMRTALENAAFHLSQLMKEASDKFGWRVSVSTLNYRLGMKVNETVLDWKEPTDVD